MHKQYRFTNALRPFSLVVALVSCGLGARLASLESSLSAVALLLVIAAGLLLQIGVNLINDMVDLDFPGAGGGMAHACEVDIRRNYRLGLICFAIAMAIGIYFVALRGWPMLVVGLTGIAGAFAYTAEPINYKRRGLGIPMVFLLMGVLMVQGAYLALSGHFSNRILLHSLPVSTMVSLLLLSNELRDYEGDRKHDIATLSVRIGFRNGVWLFWGLILLAYTLSMGLYAADQLRRPLWLLIPLLLTPILYHQMQRPDRNGLTPMTGRFFLLFGLAYAIAL